MIKPAWFDANEEACKRLESVHNKRIYASVILPNNMRIMGIGDLWTYTNGNRDKAAVTVVYECMTQPYVFSQTRIHLSADQASMIRPSSRSDADFEYPGDLQPEKIPAEKNEYHANNRPFLYGLSVVGEPMVKRDVRQNNE